jgi:hypothetical protein
MSMFGWNIHPKQLIAQPLLKDKCLSNFCLVFMSQIVVHELSVFENDLYVVVMSYLTTFHVVVASILWL